MPGTLDQMFTAMRDGYGVAMPAGDFLVSRPYDVLVAGVLEAKHIGRGVIDGVECEHLAFRNGETDWQLWVELGPKPMPRKVVVTSKTLAAAPQYTVRIKTWKTDVTPAAGTFTFVPPRGRGSWRPTPSSTSTNYPRACRWEVSDESSRFSFSQDSRSRRGRLGPRRGLGGRGGRRRPATPVSYAGVARRTPVDRDPGLGKGAPGPGVARDRDPGLGKGAPGPGVVPDRDPGLGKGAPGPGVANAGGPVNRVGVR